MILKIKKYSFYFNSRIRSYYCMMKIDISCTIYRKIKYFNLMQKLVSLVLVLALASTIANGRFLQTTTATTPKRNITFDATLGCGACITGGYIYCHKLAENADVLADVPVANRVCCKDNSTCAAASDALYNCSISYTDRTYAKFVCPFNKNQCGQNKDFSIGNNTA
jgi:hypothetical protein